MPNTVLGEWAPFLVSIGTIVGAIIWGFIQAKKPPGPTLKDDLPVQAAGILLDQKTIHDVVKAIEDGFASICQTMKESRENETRDLLKDMLEELKKAPQPPKTRNPPRA